MNLRPLDLARVTLFLLTVLCGIVAVILTDWDAAEKAAAVAGIVGVVFIVSTCIEVD
jgi:hypothetical protein